MVWWEKTDKATRVGRACHLRVGPVTLGLGPHRKPHSKAEAPSLSRGCCVLGDEPVLHIMLKVTSPKSQSLAEGWGGLRLVPLPEEATEAAGFVETAAPRRPTGPEEQKSHAA